jgi:hypothetical protein
MRTTRSLLVIATLLFCGVLLITGCTQNPQATLPQASLTIYKSEASWAVLYHDIKSLKKNADVVIEGTITGVSSMDGKPPLVFTKFIFHINHVILDPKHLVVSDHVIVNQTGGIVGNNLYEIEDDPLFQRGEEAILFLHQYSPSLYDVIGGPSGRFRVQGGKVTTINDEGVKFSTSMSEADFQQAVQQA